jgi:hypothetical protein
LCLWHPNFTGVGKLYQKKNLKGWRAVIKEKRLRNIALEEIEE